MKFVHWPCCNWYTVGLGCMKRKSAPHPPRSTAAGLIACPVDKILSVIRYKTRMWANSQRDGRPAEYRCRPLFNAANFGWRPLPEWRAVTLPRRKSRWNLLEFPKLPNRSQPLLGRSSPYCGYMWRVIAVWQVFFRLSIHALVAKIQPEKVVRTLGPIIKYAYNTLKYVDCNF